MIIAFTRNPIYATIMAMTTTYKLWHDDIRRPPDESWFWARTNNQALDWLLKLTFLDEEYDLEVHLDHDMGYGIVDEETLDRLGDEGYYLAGDAEEDGVQLLQEWTLLPDAPRPDKVTIHSWNPEGAKRMANFLADYGIKAEYDPYCIPGRETDRNMLLHLTDMQRRFHRD